MELESLVVQAEFRKRILPSELKLQLLTELNKPGITYKKLCQKAHLNEHTLHGFIKRHHKQLPLYGKSGRPGKLDEISVRYLVSEVRRTQPRDKSEIYHLIRQEVRCTAMRRYPDVEFTKEMGRIAQPSVVRWAINIFALVSENQ